MLGAASRSAERRSTIPVVAYLAEKNHGWYALAYVLLALLTIWSIFPIYWVIATSFRPGADMYNRSLALWPTTTTLDNYRQVLFQTSFATGLSNSVLVAAIVTPISIVVAGMCAYSLTRLHYRGRRLVARVLIGSYLAPGAITFIAVYVLMVRLNLVNSLLGLILTQIAGFVPFGTWLLVGYFRSLPIELEEAALVDGASRWILLWQIVAPLALPAMVVVAVYSFTASWNDFLLPVMLLQRKEVMTAPVVLTAFQVSDVTYWGPIMAASALMALPPALLYLIGQRWVISGWTVGAVKA
jgi:multiple sugar transport system permease protein